MLSRSSLLRIILVEIKKNVLKIKRYKVVNSFVKPASRLYRKGVVRFQRRSFLMAYDKQGS